MKNHLFHPFLTDYRKPERTSGTSNFRSNSQSSQGRSAIIVSLLRIYFQGDCLQSTCLPNLRNNRETSERLFLQCFARALALPSHFDRTMSVPPPPLVSSSNGSIQMTSTHRFPRSFTPLLLALSGLFENLETS